MLTRAGELAGSAVLPAAGDTKELAVALIHHQSGRYKYVNISIKRVRAFRLNKISHKFDHNRQLLY